MNRPNRRGNLCQRHREHLRAELGYTVPVFKGSKTNWHLTREKLWACEAPTVPTSVCVECQRNPLGDY